MIDYNALLSQYAQAGTPVEPPSMVDNKKATLADAASAKKTALGGNKVAYDATVAGRTGYGLGSMEGEQRDLATMDAAQIFNKYGVDRGEELISQAAKATGQVSRDSTTERNLLKTVGDSGIDIVSGAVNGVGGIAALGLGMANAEAGNAASRILNEATQWGQNQQSDSLNARRRFAESQNELAAKDNEKIYNESEKTTVDSLARIGRDVLDSVAIGASDGQTLTSGIAQGIGSMATVAPIAKGVGALGNLAISAEKKALMKANAGVASALGKQSIDRALVAAGELAPATIAIGAQSGGGIYSSTVQDAMETMKDRTDLSQAQKEELANDAGLRAAAVGTPLSLLAGAGVAKFEANPFAKVGVRTALQNMGKETLEEGFQSGAEGFSQNVGIQNAVEPTRDLGKGVGRQIGEGALYGAGTAGAVSSVGVAQVSVGDAANIAARGLDAVLTRADRLLAAEEAKSPVSEARVTRAVTELNNIAPEAVAILKEASANASAEGKASIDALVQKVADFDKFDVSSLKENAPDIVKNLLGPVTSKVVALTKMGSIVSGLKDAKQLGIASVMIDMLNDYNDMLGADNNEIADLDDDHLASKLAKQYGAVANKATQMPSVMKAIEKATLLAQQPIATVTEADIATPAGQESIAATLVQAELAPDKANAENINLILKQADAGKITITPRQRSAMSAAAAILNAALDASTKAAALGLNRMTEVSDQIQIDDKRAGQGQLSALAHAKRIRAAYDGKDYETGAAYLEDFKLFAIHMQNKVAAINAHFEAGTPYSDARTYQALSADRTWKESKLKMGVTPQSEKSVRFAQTVGLEAERLTAIVNNLSDAFPELNVGKLAPVPLAPALNGKANEVANEFRAGTRTNKANPAPVTPAAPVAPVTTPAPEKAPVAPAVSKLDTSKMTPEEVNDRLQAVMSEKNYQDNPDFAVLEAAMTEIEDKAAKEYEAQQAAEEAEDNRIAAEKKAKAEAKKKLQPEPEIPVVPDIGAPERFAAMNLTELGNQIADLNDNPDRTPLQDSNLEEMQSVYDARVEAQIEKREKANPKPEVTEVSEPVVSDSGDVFDGLVKGSMFEKAYKYSKRAISRLVGREKPLKDVHDALQSTATLKAFTDVDQKSTLDADVAEAYSKYILFGNKLKKEMKDSLEAFIKKKNVMKAMKDTDKTTPNNWRNGRQLNITREVDGTLQYDETLLDSAILAGLQWRLTAMDRAPIIDERDAAAILSLEESKVKPYLTMLQNTLGHSDAIRAIAAMLPKYWGVSPISSESDSHVEGIALGVAAELFDAMIKRGMLEEMPAIQLDATETTTGQPKTVNRWKLVEVQMDEQLSTYPDAIEQAVAVEPEEVRFIGDSTRPPTAKSQMRNSFVANTPAALKALDAEGETPFFANLPLVALYEAMGLELVMEDFGEEANELTTNVNHFKTLDGRNTNLASSFKSIMGLIGDIRNQAAVAGVDADNMPVRFAYNMSKVNRMQQLGRFGPQASKFVRELLLPTRSTLDLSKVGSKDHQAFGLGLAQALGIKVHTKSVQKSNEEVFKKLELDYSGAVEALSSWLNEYDPKGTPRSLTVDERAALKEGLGKNFTPVGMMAIMEYARYKKMKKAQRKSFVTSLYVEADGVTNGPINSMVLMTTGQFTPEWITNIRKGGYFIGLDKMDMNTFRGREDLGGTVDLYQAASNAFKKALTFRRELFKSEPKFSQKMEDVLTLVSTFVPELFADTEDGLVVDRGLLKNPLTVTIYGAGGAGVAAKITSAVMDAIYARMTAAHKKMLANKGMSLGQAMFGEDGDVKYADFLNTINSLTQETLRETRKSIYIKKTPTADNNTGFDPLKFTLSLDELANMSQNLLVAFVTPMRKGIAETLGGAVFRGTELIQQTTQIQSLFIQESFFKILEAMKAKKPKNEFLSKDDLKAAMGQLIALHPLVQSEEQSYFIAGSDAADDTSVALAESFAGRFPQNPMVYGPREAGVKGIPFLVIGMGDGMMMQRLSTMFGSPEGTLKVFDGMNMKLSTITEDSLKANEAVHDSWQSNPFEAVSESYKAFLLNGDLEITPNVLSGLSKAFSNKKLTAEDAMGQIRNLGLELQFASIEAAARKAALAEYQIHVDQMASAAAPFVTKGKKQFTSTDPVVVAEELNVIYSEKLTALYEGVTLGDGIEADLAIVGKAKAGVRTIGLTALKNLQKQFVIPANLKAVFDQVLSTLTPKGYEVIYGDPTLLAQYASNPQDAADVLSGKTSGWTDIGAKVVYLANPSAETLVHELVHAATMEALMDHYNGKLKGDDANAMRVAVTNLEKLMAQFLSSEGRLLAAASPELKRAYSNAKAAIEGFASAEGMNSNIAKAAALNEFMAWALTNQNLVTVLKSMEANPLVRMASTVIALIKKLVFRRKPMPVAGNDVFSNLLFNSAIVMAVQGGRGVYAAPEISLKQFTANDDPRLTRVQETFDTLVTDYLSTAADPLQAASDSIQNGVDLALDVQITGGFTMNLQQSVTMQSVVAALATQAKIDPASMARAQTLYSQVIKELKVEDFMADPQSQDPNARAEATRKYDWLMGKSLVKTDAEGRSSLLSAFYAMAIVNDEFRTVLAKMAPTKIGLNKNDSADNVLENVGMRAMEKLKQTLSKTDKSVSVQAAIDSLTTNIMDIAERQNNLLETAVDGGNNYLNRTNAKVVEGITALSNYGLEKSEQLAMRNPNSKAAQNVNAAMKLTSLLVSEEKADAVAMGIMSGTNRTNLVQPFKELISDLVGRTSSNAVIMDMIKKVRSVVQQDRQSYRENVPTIIASKFNRQLLDKEWSAMFRGMGKTDLSSLLVSGRNRTATLDLMVNPAARATEITRLEKVLTDANNFNGKKQIQKSKQLAEFMVKGNAGVNLLRNAYAISNLWGEAGIPNGRDLTNEIDQLTSLYALGNIDPSDMVELVSLVQNEPEGVDFALAYLTGQREEEMRKANLNPMAKANHYKGYIPSEQTAGLSLIIANDSDSAKLRFKGYIRTGDYIGSSLESGFASKGYYFSPVGGKGAFSQGLLQNVNQTAGGVDLTTGLTVGGLTAGNTVDPIYIQKLIGRMKFERDTGEPLLPVRDETGKIVSFERSVDPVQADRLKKDTHLAKMIGVWRGRQVEEVKGQQMNYLLIDNLKTMYDADIQKSQSNKTEYVDLFAPSSDPIITDAMNLMNQETIDYISQVFGKKFMVRKDMINDAIGYRAASVRDIWSGVSHWSPKTTKVMERTLISVFGVDAYKYVVNAEKTLQNFVKDAKVLIVMKSVIVPAGNLVSNMVQLMSRGVSPATLYRSMPRKTAEIDSYVKNRLRHVEAEAELLAANNNPVTATKLKAEIKLIEDSYRRLSIWPLINAGEFSAISDAGISREEILLAEGKLHAYMENAVRKLPDGLQTVGKYALVTKDTALFQAMQKATEYGDFLGKAVLYDHLIAKGKTPVEALAQISEEFVNYDRLPGRFRGALESNGMLWFYNFKIRSVKVAASMIRNNPLQTLLAGFIPTIPLLGNVGTVAGDNFLTILAEGRIGNSMGIGQGLHAPQLNPWWNMVN